MSVIYPNISVKLVGVNGNAFNLLGIMRKELRKNNVPHDEIQKFLKESMSGNYDELLRTCYKWVNVE